MSHEGETFFTAVGCMDGRVQDTIAQYGKQKFNVKYPDTITEAGIVGQLAAEVPDEKLLESVRFKVADVSIGKHHSKGVVVHGHQECAGNPVEDELHKQQVIKTSEVVKGMLSEPKPPVIPVFVRRGVAPEPDWVVEELKLRE
jgi:hypothetical protein